MLGQIYPPVIGKVVSNKNEEYEDYWLLGPAFLFLFAVAPLPYEFYMLLRLVSVPLFGLLIYHSIDKSSVTFLGLKYFWVFIGFGLLYNPFAPVHLTKDIWVFLNLLTAISIAAYWYGYNNAPETEGNEKSVSFSDILDPAPPINQTPEEESTNVLMQMVEQTLRMQAFQGLGFETSNEDDFISGYIGGYCDAVSQINGIDNNSAEGAAILTIGFQAVYKTDDPMKNFFEKQSSSDAMKEGIQVGFQDVMDWLKPSSEEDKKSPDGLIKYLLEETDDVDLEEVQNAQEVKEEQSRDTEKLVIESMIEFADLYYGKSADQLLKLLRKNKMHYLDDGGDTISVNPKNNEPFHVIFGTDRSEEKPSMTIFCTEDYVGITIFVMEKSTHSWAGSLEPTPASGMGNSAKALFNKLLSEYHMRDFNSF